MIFPDLNKIEIYLCTSHVDMRKSYGGLSILTEHVIKQNPTSGNLFCFCNRSRTIVKILYWDKNGFCVWQKKISREKFYWPRNEAEASTIKAEELYWLLNGVDFNKAHKVYKYKSVSL